MIVYVESKVLEDPAIADDESFGAVIKKFCTFREGLNHALQCLNCLFFMDFYVVQ